MHFPHFPRKSPGRNPARSKGQLSGIIRGVAFATVLGLLLLPVASAAQDDTTAKQDDAASRKMRIEGGEKIFNQRCASCHNKAVGDDSPFGAPNLHGIFKGPSAITPAEAATIIVKGKNSMPGWGTVLTKSDVGDVIAYLRTQ
jgi:mono/diheme cytochrome c family protein